MNLSGLIKRLNKAKEEYLQLKSKLTLKELESYRKWKLENPKDRSAMDKVVANLKLQDEDWLQGESRLLELEIECFQLKNIYDVVKVLLMKSDVTVEDVNKFVDSCL
jgi:hypothetical protein